MGYVTAVLAFVCSIHVHRAQEASSFCDFWNMTFGDFTACCFFFYLQFPFFYVLIRSKGTYVHVLRKPKILFSYFYGKNKLYLLKSMIVIKCNLTMLLFDSIKCYNFYIKTKETLPHFMQDENVYVCMQTLICLTSLISVSLLHNPQFSHLFSQT